MKDVWKLYRLMDGTNGRWATGALAKGITSDVRVEEE
jgi:hypothetical protein